MLFLSFTVTENMFFPSKALIKETCNRYTKTLNTKMSRTVMEGCRSSTLFFPASYKTTPALVTCASLNLCGSQKACDQAGVFSTKITISVSSKIQLGAKSLKL